MANPTLSLPPGYSPIRDARSAGDGSCFLGVVVHIKSPFRLKNGDWALEFTMQDEFSPGNLGGQSSLVCTVRRRIQSELPQDGKPGDIAVARQVKLEILNQKPCATNELNLRSDIGFVPNAKIPVPEFSTAYSVGGQSKLLVNGMTYAKSLCAAEQMAIISLNAAAARFLPDIQTFAKRTSNGSSTTISTGPTFSSSTFPGNKKGALIKDMVISNFYNIIGEVVKKWDNDNDTVDIYITDYTENNGLYPYSEADEVGYLGFGAQKHWNGPVGQVTIAIRLWDPHASWVRHNVVQGDLLFLQNVHAKLSQLGHLEGAIHQDRKYPNKICAHKVQRAEQITAHNQRKQVYQDTIEPKKASHLLPQNVPKKASAKTSAKKKEEKKERQRLQKELEQQELEQKAEEEEKLRAGINSNIRAGFSEIKLSTVTEIVNNPSRKTTTEEGIALQLPWINCKYRTRIRVVDMWPLKLTDFSRHLADPWFNPGVSAERREKFQHRFEWSFCLLVEDADVLVGTVPDRLMLTFGNEQGQNLLKMDAVNLKQHPERCQQIEEKLFILWGNLRERKIALLRQGIDLPLPSGDPRLQLQSKPFECCVQEFGEFLGESEEDEGNPNKWVRRFTAFETTIAD